MITAKDIKKILDKIPKGTTMTVKKIHELVEEEFTLTDDDWKPHTETRETNYPKWKHKVQAVLAELKKAQKVVHNPGTNSYTF